MHIADRLPPPVTRAEEHSLTVQVSLSWKSETSRTLTRERIFHHQYDGVDRVGPRGHDLLDQESARFGVSRNESLFAHVRGKFMLGHLHHLTSELMQNPLPIRWRPMF